MLTNKIPKFFLYLAAVNFSRVSVSISHNHCFSATYLHLMSPWRTRKWSLPELDLLRNKPTKATALGNLQNMHLVYELRGYFMGTCK